MIAAAAFYVFAAILLVSAGLVVTARNPVHSVLWLVLAFFNAAALFLLAGAEFLAMILVIVYVGAVAVLFNRRFIKSGKASTSNWANAQLTDAQLIYAANDAWAAAMVHEALRNGAAGAAE